MAIDMFLKFVGAKPPIDGESIDAGHPNEIEVLAYSWGVSNAGTARPSPQDLSFTTYYSKASILLFQACCVGTVVPSATLTLRKAGAKPVEYLKIKLDNVLVTSDSMGGSGGEDRMTENFTLHFDKINFSYTLARPDGTTAESVGGFDFAEMEKL